MALHDMSKALAAWVLLSGLCIVQSINLMACDSPIIFKVLVGSGCIPNNNETNYKIHCENECITPCYGNESVGFSCHNCETSWRGLCSHIGSEKIFERLKGLVVMYLIGLVRVLIDMILRKVIAKQNLGLIIIKFFL